MEQLDCWSHRTCGRVKDACVRISQLYQMKLGKTQAHCGSLTDQADERVHKEREIESRKETKQEKVRETKGVGRLRQTMKSET